MNLKPTFEHYFPEGTKGGECAAFAEKLVSFGPVGDSFASKLAYVKKYGSTVVTDIQVGDVVLTDDSKINGHIFIVNCDMGDTWQVTESNYYLDQIIHHKRLVPKNFIGLKGHIRAPLKVKIMQNFTQKILVLWSNIPQSEKDPVLAGINKYLASVAQKTANGFTVNCDFADTTQQFHTITSNNPDGSAVTYANPDEIASAAEAVRPNVPYDIVCLIYNDANVIGAPPNHPVDNPQISFGFNICSIPMSWVMAPSNESGQQAFDFITNEAAQFFAHEISHANYYLANTKSGANQRDRTHDTNPYQQVDQVYLFFIDLLIELTAWWQFLAATAPQGVPMVIFKFDDNATEYALVDDATLVGITASGLPKLLNGRAQKLVVLPAAQRSNFAIVTAAIS